MTREDILACIYADTSVHSCSGNCSKPEENDNASWVCEQCADKQLREYEDRLREEAVKEFATQLLGRLADEKKRAKSHKKSTKLSFKRMKKLVKRVIKAQKRGKRCHH